MTFNSVYEMFDPLTTVRKQRFWDWFSGDSLHSRWTTGGSGGSQAMTDDIDGGYTISTNSTNNTNQFIHFNNKRPFDEDACKIIAIMKRTQDLNTIDHGMGMINDYADCGNALTLAGTDLMYIGATESATKFGIVTADASTRSNSTSSVNDDNSWHVFEGEMTASDNQLSIDGVLEVTKTTNLCTGRVQPFAGVRTGTTAQRDMSLRYMECYNT